MTAVVLVTVSPQGTHTPTQRLGDVLMSCGRINKVEWDEAHKLEPKLKDVQDEVEAVRRCAWH